MKKLTSFVLVFALLAGFAPLSNALVPDNLTTYSSSIQTYGINNVIEDQAEMLKALGLFVGSDKGFELEKGLTRAEAGALIVRVMGAEAEALSQENLHQFTDVPEWADKYVGWLYQNGVTKGVSNTQFGSEQYVTYWQFATMLCRAGMGSDDFLSWYVGTEREMQSLDGDGVNEGSGFKRREAVGLITRFLQSSYAIGAEVLDMPRTVAQYLIEKGAFTEEQFFAVAPKNYPIYYYYYNHDDNTLSATILGMTMAESKLTNIDVNTAFPSTALPHFYATTLEDSEMVIYQMDCLTMEETEIFRLPCEDDTSWRNVNYYVTSGGKDYIGVRCGDTESLIEIDGTTAKLIAEGSEFGFNRTRYSLPSIWRDNTLTLCIDETLYYITENGVDSHTLDEGTTVVAVQDEVAVLYHEDDGVAVIEGLNMTDWNITDTYYADIPQSEYPKSVSEMIWQREYNIYGEAGYFFVRDGRLIRATERPVYSIGGIREGASGHAVILTRSEGYQYYGSGDTLIILYDPYYTGEDEWREYVALDETATHGIRITEVGYSDRQVMFYSSSDVGMQHFNVYTYLLYYNSEEDHQGIYVIGYTAGRPEMMEHDTQWYIDQEQERLNELGYNPW